MNYLAHAYLSFGHPEVLTGNMISDFVKGKSRYTYPTLIQQGIMLHRAIDAFTDAHPATKEAMQVFRPYYRLYSGAIMDIFYDHFLAADETIFKKEGLLPFTHSVYATLDANAAHLPPLFAHLLVYMKAENWLYRYKTKEGIEKSIIGLVRRAAYMHDSTMAIQLFNRHYNVLKDCYAIFIKDVKMYAKQEFDKLTV